MLLLPCCCFLAFSHSRGNGSCRWREVLLCIAGMSQGMCEKPDSFYLLKLLVHSLMADRFLGMLLSHHLRGLLIPLGKKEACRKPM